MGVVFAPLLGPYIDKNPRNQTVASFEDYRAWKIKRCGIALAITNTLNVLMGAVVLIPILEVQVVIYTLSFVITYTFYRPNKKLCETANTAAILVNYMNTAPCYQI